MQSSTSNNAPIESARSIDEMTVSEFILQREAIIQFVRDALQSAVDKQKENADKHGRTNVSRYKKGDRVILSTEGVGDTEFTNLGASKFVPRFIGPFRVLKMIGDIYTLDILSSLPLHRRSTMGD